MVSWFQRLEYRPSLQRLRRKRPLTDWPISYAAVCDQRFPGWLYNSGPGICWNRADSVIIMAVCFAVGSFILNKTYFGRYFYAVGGNIEAAKLSGIRVGAVKYLVFALSGFFSGLAGLVLLSRTNSGNASAAKGEEFNVITCVV